VALSADQAQASHAFVDSPNRTLVALSIPVLFSLIAEPLTGLVDTAFVARLGAPSLAALGVGTIVLSGSFWIFNFLGIGTQTEVAQALGSGRRERAREINGLAIVVSLSLGLAVLLLGVPAAPWVASAMGAGQEVHALAVTYMRVRLLGAPAVLVTVAAFGTLRGLQDMKTPLWIAIGVNALNLVLDPILIFGLAGFPAYGVAGAAAASSVSQWAGAAVVVSVVVRRLGRPSTLHGRDVMNLFVVGRDLFLRTGLLTAFLILATRAATRAGAEAGAAHQAIRQVWAFTALFLDAFAVVGQSLVGFFVGGQDVRQARRVAWYVCAWSLGTGAVLGAGMILGTSAVRAMLVPPSAAGLFGTAWLICALAQPLNAVAFATDGIHWGTGDYRWLRDAVFVATLAGVSGLWLLDESSPGALNAIWSITAGWIVVRSAFGVIRVWPGVGKAPLREMEDGSHKAE
jgi:MATE family multidrug resistance protein